MDGGVTAENRVRGGGAGLAEEDDDRFRSKGVKVPCGTFPLDSFVIRYSLHTVGSYFLVYSWVVW